MINSKPRQNHHRDRLGHVSAHATRCHLVRDCTCSHGVVAVHTAILIRDDKRASGSAHLVCQCPAFEPPVQTSFPAQESIKKMSGGEWLWGAQAQAHAGSALQGAFTAMSRSNPGLGLGGASSISVNCLNLSVSRLKKT
jgi:hypothetical protein